MRNIKERLDNVRALIQKEEFLEGKGLSNEVNIRMFCYEPEDEMAVRHFIDQLSTDLTLKCNLKLYHLYEIFLAICEDKRIIKSSPRMEEKKGKEYLLNQMHSIATDDMFIQKMQYEPHEKGDVLLLTGVGEVFPFMRIHALLDALQPHFPNIPILVMYPGTFNGTQVKLFDKLKPNSYYRAFSIL